MALATWTDPVDRADGYVVGATNWNQLVGDTGNLQFLYENSWIPVAVNTAATSTSSTSEVDLLTLTPTNSIGINDWAMVFFECRKLATFATTVSFGLKINSTTVLAALPGSGHTRPISSATARAEAGFVRFVIPPRSTANYGFGIQSDWIWYTTAGAPATSILDSVAAATGSTTLAAAVPNAAITSVTIRAINNSNNNSVEVKNAGLYMLRSQ